MAKSTTSSKRKVAVFSIKGWDAAHYKTTNQYANAVQRIMVATTNDISRMVAGKTIDTDKPFSFADYPAIQREVDKAVADMANTMTMTIEKGSRKEWLSATRKGDAFLDSIMTTSKVSKKRLQTMQDKNLDALSAFQSRKVDGMNLSQRVWKYAGQFKDQIEQCIDVGLGEGRSADELSRDVRQNLKDPNRLFRRVRDKRGNLVLSKNARAFHPGQGVYRSSYKNAMRLTRSEINMAYRESDYLRWQQLDFVIGIEIHRSNHEPLCECKMCERLQGKYPKTFKFKGWHPQCMCYATPILVTDDEFDAQELSDLKSALHGTEYKKLAVKGEITDVPDGFKSWVDDNKDASKNWKSVPYFVKDNFVDGELAKGLKPAAMQSKAVEGTPDEPVNHVPYDQLDKEAQRHWSNFLYDHFPVNYDWKEACRLYGIPGIDEYVQHIDSAYDNNEYWRENELIAEQARIDAALKAEIERCHEQAKQGIADYVAALKDSFKWVGTGDKSYIQYSYDYMSKEATEKYPNYKAVINALNGGSFDVQRLQNKVTAAKDAYNAAISSAKGIVAKYTGQVDVSKLESLIAEQISESRPANLITKEIVNAMSDVTSAANAAPMAKTNVADVNAALGVEKGDEMTFEQANEHRGNLDYKMGFLDAISESPYKKLKDHPYHVNCQSCVAAHELRVRGWDVEAQPNYQRAGTKPTELSYDTTLIWIDPNTGKKPVINWMTNAYRRKSKAATEAAMQWYDSAMKEPGRYSLTFRWKCDREHGGHVISAERLSDGTLRIYDPQTGKIESLKSVCEDLNFTIKYTCGVQRVDNMLINKDMISGIVRKRKSR